MSPLHGPLPQRRHSSVTHPEHLRESIGRPFTSHHDRIERMYGGIASAEHPVRPGSTTSPAPSSGGRWTLREQRGDQELHTVLARRTPLRAGPMQEA